MSLNTKKVYPYILILPAIVLVGLVSFVPLIQAIRTSMFKTRFLKLSEFIGFFNYIKIFTSHEGWSSIFNSFFLTFGTLFFVMPLAFFLATILNRSYRYNQVRTTFRIILLLPYAISWLIASMLWTWMLNPYLGPISYLIRILFNWTMPSFFTEAALAMPALIHITVWRYCPLAMLFILAGLQTIPQELFEAAKIDGATGWQNFKLITFPLISNTILVVMVLLSLYTFNMVELIVASTGGGPNKVTTTLAFKTWQEAFQFWHLGYASSLAVTIFIFNVVFSLIYVRVLKMDNS